MSKPLTAFEYYKLDRMRLKLEELMQDNYVVQNSNVIEVYKTVMEQINYETDPYLDRNVYSIPGILKPVPEW
jgi:hypothetical protein